MGLHILTGEYPPQLGGVSDYTRFVAAGLAAEDDEVNVWCPDVAAQALNEFSNSPGVSVHRALGQLTPADLRRVGKMLDQFPLPRRLLVQWVPHGFGYHAMNVPFCFWLWYRARRKGDVVEIMAHECFLPFKRWAWKQNLAALIQRLMTVILLRAASHVWISIPAWEARWRPLSLGRRVTFTWLPVPSNIAVANDPHRVSAVRRRYGVNGEQLLGHFGTYGRNDRKMLQATLPLLLRNGAGTKMILMGRDSDSMRSELVGDRPELSDAIQATGTLDAEDLSLHLSACDVMLQPCQDGVSTRRTTVMAGLAHGRPIVTTTGRLTESLWRESQAVSLVRDGDVLALANETQRVLSDETERERLSSAALLLYQEKFDVAHVVAALRRASA